MRAQPTDRQMFLAGSDAHGSDFNVEVNEGRKTWAAHVRPGSWNWS